jgi:acetyl esterase/lipase
MKTLLATLLFMSIFTTCQPASRGSAAPQFLPAKTLLNISYGKDSMQRMDVYLPANRSADSTNVLVLIHGGGWASGDKSEFAAAVPVLQQKLPQYAIVNINYRLANQVANHFPTQENDVQTALQTIMDKAAEYQISNDVVLLGASAGAHLALLQGYKHTTPVVPKAVISFFGPADLADIYNRQTNKYYKMGLQLLIGGTPASKPDVFTEASPIYFAGRQNIPTLLLHGAKDPLVPVAQSKALKEKLEKAGVPVELVIYLSEGHGWYGANLANSYERIENFLNKLADHTKSGLVNEKRTLTRF